MKRKDWTPKYLLQAERHELEPKPVSVVELVIVVAIVLGLFAVIGIAIEAAERVMG